jgi:hypothetical protein
MPALGFPISVPEADLLFSLTYLPTSLLLLFSPLFSTLECRTGSRSPTSRTSSGLSTSCAPLLLSSASFSTDLPALSSLRKSITSVSISPSARKTTDATRSTSRRPNISLVTLRRTTTLTSPSGPTTRTRSSRATVSQTDAKVVFERSYHRPTSLYLPLWSPFLSFLYFFLSFWPPSCSCSIPFLNTLFRLRSGSHPSFSTTGHSSLTVPLIILY